MRGLLASARFPAFFLLSVAWCLCRLGRFEEAVTALREARRLGYAELRKLRTEEDLAAVRERPEVLALLNWECCRRMMLF